MSDLVGRCLDTKDRSSLGLAGNDKAMIRISRSEETDWRWRHSETKVTGTCEAPSCRCTAGCNIRRVPIQIRARVLDVERADVLVNGADVIHVRQDGGTRRRRDAT